MKPNFLLLATLFGLASAQCAFDYQTPSADGMKCYSIFTMELTYDKANTMCRNIGGVISMSQPDADQTTLKGLIQKKMQCSPRSRSVHGYWNGVNGVQCGIVDLTTGMITYENCGDYNSPKAAFICESAGTGPVATTAPTAAGTTTVPATTTPGCEELGADDTENAGNNIAVFVTRTFDQAQAYCKCIEAHLVFLLDPNTETQIQTVFDPKGITTWYMGLQKEAGNPGDNGPMDYKWLDGTALDPLKHIGFAGGNPTPTDALQCVVYDKALPGWKNVACTEAHAFVCQPNA
uniref:C-type lectin domain-containing protein n=1 Tax=Steinernema glaseri TaxID=37863 RepID=A0A1I7ZSD8_9BILA